MRWFHEYHFGIRFNSWADSIPHTVMPEQLRAPSNAHSLLLHLEFELWNSQYAVKILQAFGYKVYMVESPKGPPACTTFVFTST